MFLGVGGYPDDDTVKYVGGSLNNVYVADGYGIKASWNDSSTVNLNQPPSDRKTEPYLRISSGIQA